MIPTTRIKQMIGLICATLWVVNANAQIYCIPAVVPYAPTMPGITQFNLNTIDRTSADLESPSSGFVSTGLSTDLIMGQTYPVSITHTIDASICQDMNIRVWIDYNHDGQLDDVGETVISTDHHLPGTYTTTFTVPLTAFTGTTRLRATAKMSNLGGHSLPTPCDIPADPIGYHGEMEDYTVNLISTTGIQDINSIVASFEVFSNPIEVSSVALVKLNRSEKIKLELFNTLGEKVNCIIPVETNRHGEYSCSLDAMNELNNGIYLLRLLVGDQEYARRVIINANE